MHNGTTVKNMHVTTWRSHLKVVYVPIITKVCSRTIEPCKSVDQSIANLFLGDLGQLKPLVSRPMKVLECCSASLHCMGHQSPESWQLSSSTLSFTDYEHLLSEKILASSQARDMHREESIDILGVMELSIFLCLYIAGSCHSPSLP